MHFAPDTEDSLEFAIVIANTDPSASRSGTDELETVEQLAALLAEYPFTGRIDGDAVELAEVRETRAMLRRLWRLDRDSIVSEVNRVLHDAAAVPYLTRHDDIDWHIHATSADAPLAERLRVEVAFALIDVIRVDETSRMRVCDADDCSGLFLDLSRNGSKRFCSVRCGNRMNTIAFRERKAAG